MEDTGIVVTIQLATNRFDAVQLKAKPVDVVNLMAAATGCSVDIEPMEPGRTTATATVTKDGKTLRATGVTVDDAARKLAIRMTTEMVY